MSVSDPLLKQLKGHVYSLRTDPNPIKDDHASLKPFCETLECIFRKGLKQNHSLFGLSRRDYWHWVEVVTNEKNTMNGMSGAHPYLSMAVQTVKSCDNVFCTTARGRLFTRAALQKKALFYAVDQLTKSSKGVDYWYEPDYSILGDEILREIFGSLLFQVVEINFQLEIKNCAFLEDTWLMPIYIEQELVPTKDLGLQIQHSDTRVIVSGIDKRGVVFDYGELEVGDVLNTLMKETLRYIQKGRIQSLLKQNAGYPVKLAFSKCRLADGSLFPPIAGMLKKCGKDEVALQDVLNQDERDRRKNTKKKPPHAILPEEEWDEIPVHNADDSAEYCLKFVGQVEIGQQGGVSQIEGAIGKILTDKNPDKHPELLQDVTMELGETDVIVKLAGTQELFLKHSYTEISACGRRVDVMKYIAYIAGETTCTLSKQFVAYVFKCPEEFEGKTILCSIAQGFSRTHWFV